MHKNELRANLTLINWAIIVYELRVGTIVPYSNETKLGPMTYYSLHVDSPWIGVHNLTR